MQGSLVEQMATDISLRPIGPMDITKRLDSQNKQIEHVVMSKKLEEDNLIFDNMLTEAIRRIKEEQR